MKLRISGTQKLRNWETNKLETTAVDLSKLSDVVKNEVVKKTVYDIN